MVAALVLALADALRRRGWRAGHRRELHRRPDRRRLHRAGRLQRLVRARLRHLQQRREDRAARRRRRADRGPRRGQRAGGAGDGAGRAGARRRRSWRWPSPAWPGPAAAVPGKPVGTVWLAWGPARRGRCRPSGCSSPATAPRCGRPRCACALQGCSIGEAARRHEMLLCRRLRRGRARRMGRGAARGAARPPLLCLQRGERRRGAIAGRHRRQPAAGQPAGPAAAAADPEPVGRRRPAAGRHHAAARACRWPAWSTRR